MSDTAYPTYADLDRLKAWPPADINGALDEARRLWSEHGSVRDWLTAHEGYVVIDQPGERHLRLVTGDWPGNESIVSALRVNTRVWAMAWCLSARGGLHIFRYLPERGPR